MTVFVLALLLITAIELISGKPLSSIFGGADTGHDVEEPRQPVGPGADHHPDVDHLDHDDDAGRELLDDDDHDHRRGVDQHHGAGGRPDDNDDVARRLVHDHHLDGGAGGG